jgi:hypothetical protein
LKAAAAFANAFLCAFLFDSALTVLDGALDASGSKLEIAPLRNLVAWVVFGCAPLLVLIAALSPQLPRARLMLLALGTWWVNLGAVPFGSVLDSQPVSEVLFGVVQAALALPALRWIRARSAGASWLFRSAFLPPAPARSRWAVALVIFAVPLALVLGAAGWAMVAAERATGGFVGFGLDGISFDERRYTRGDREVVLVGMSHVGRKGVYDALLRPRDDTPTVVLAEGVTDAQGLLPKRHIYEPMAADLGLDVQPQFEEMIEAPGAPAVAEDLVEVEHADLDVSAFRPGTVELLRLGIRIVTGDAAARADLESWAAEPGAGEAWRGLADDLLEKRNAHVLERVDAALARRPRVVVPWGALHLTGIEAGLFARGFTLASSEPRSFLPYGAVIGLLARASGAR